MSTLRRILVFGSAEGQLVEINSMKPLGTSSSGGIPVAGLKYKEDYAIVSPSENGLTVHPLRGKNKATLTLKEYEPFRIDDLTVILLPSAKDHSTSTADLLEQLPKILSIFSESDDLVLGMLQILKTLLSSGKMEKGMIISKDSTDKFKIMCQVGVDPDENWLSESLVQQTLTTRQPVIIQNIIGSGFDQTKSLVATGFLSIYSFPLLLRGQVLGALVIGSKRPHDGIQRDQKQIVDICVQIASIMLSQHLKEVKLLEELKTLKSQKGEGPFVTQDEGMLQVCDLAKRVASTPLAVLIQGETGVGKEVLAKWIHRNSDRKSGPFVAVNCGAIPAGLLESVLFGHRKGAFTGAVSDQIGKFQQANGGTLFLDEIGDLPETLQVKLLRVLQEGVVEPVGAMKPVQVDLRILAASHRNIPELIKAQKFREDLFYRIAEVTVAIPALRERPGDIPILSMTFLRELSADKNFSSDALNWLSSQNWNGNVRELLSAVRRAAMLSVGNEINKEDFMVGFTVQKNAHWLGGKNLDEACQRFIEEKVIQALKHSGGHRGRASELLGVTRRTLFRYLEMMKKDVTDLTPFGKELSPDSEVESDFTM